MIMILILQTIMAQHDRRNTKKWSTIDEIWRFRITGGKQKFFFPGHANTKNVNVDVTFSFERIELLRSTHTQFYSESASKSQISKGNETKKRRVTIEQGITLVRMISWSVIKKNSAKSTTTPCIHITHTLIHTVSMLNIYPIRFQ